MRDPYEDAEQAMEEAEKYAFLVGFKIAQIFDITTAEEAYFWWRSLPSGWQADHPGLEKGRSDGE